MKRSHCFLLVLLVSGCGADRRLGGETGAGGASAGGAGSAPAMTGGTTSSGTGGNAASAASNGGKVGVSIGGASSGGVTVTGAGGASNGGTASLGTGGSANGGTTTGVFNGGALSTGTGGSLNGGRTTGGTPSSGTTNGGSSGSSTGVASAGAHIGGVSNGGASAGGASGCVPVCPLYGAPCCMWEVACLGPTGGCTIDVLAANVSITYEYADLESRVAALPQDISATITDQDIAWIAADPWPAARIEMHLTDDAASRYGSILDGARDNRVFRVSCAGKPLFVGVFYLLWGAAALKTPVLHESRENGALVLRLGAGQGAWYAGPRTDCATPCQRIDRIELRAAFCRGGVMHELDPNARPPS